MTPWHRVPLHQRLSDGAARMAVVRPLTGADEEFLGAAADAGSEAWVTDLLTRAVSTLDGDAPTETDIRALTVGDRNALQLAVLAATYGAVVSWLVACPHCGAELDAEVDVTALAPAALTPPVHIENLPAFRIPTGGDLEAVAALGNADRARAALLDRCVPDAAVDQLDDDIVAAVEAAMAHADPLAAVDLDLRCAGCGETVAAELDAAFEIAQRLSGGAGLLGEVHALALAYGWGERDILDLPRPRRTEYLTLLADSGP